ncbi:MAG: hypothetical protein LBQ83_01640 [Candidatus Margulisbacteria bacterium]|nr:hypothetical protein [Candidatus Margulisiibacteriota bacterium]
MPPTVSISQQLYSLSPLGTIIASKLGMDDKNQNGTIDPDAGEGYEEFKEKYGDADIGFAANGVTFGAANNVLEEPEIVNHYYINIRFKEPEVTEAIENEISSYVYANNIPLVWQDDEQGTVMNAVNSVLGEGWNEQEVSDDEAVRMFRRTMGGLGIRGLTNSEPHDTGYNTLPELIAQKTSYCYETAQFGFWFFSQLNKNSIVLRAALTSTLLHDIVKLTDTNKPVDYFNTSAKYPGVNNRWNLLNPLHSLSEYEATLGRKENSLYHLEQAVIYNKYKLSNIGLLIKQISAQDNPDYAAIITLGEFMLDNIDIEKIMQTRNLEAASVRANLKSILLFLIKSYSSAKNNTGFERVATILQTYFPKDPQAKQFLEYYSF